ncbi:MAG TPA: Crp/Fnr family transcriptional regulator [Lachnospiraceae bacterium]
MKNSYLLNAFPFLKTIDESRREQFEKYFENAPVWLIDSFQTEDMEKGTVFVREGEPVDTIYFIASGIIKATDYRFYGITYDFMRFDNVYAMGGMEILMDLNEYRTTLRTVTPCKVLKISKQKFEKWIKSDIKALCYEAKLMGNYLLEQGRVSRAYLFLQGSNRLAMLLADRYERYAKDGVYYLKSKRQDLSDATGLCTKTINRAIKKFADDGVIGKEKTTLIIDKEHYKKLKAIVNEVIESDCKREDEDE